MRKKIEKILMIVGISFSGLIQADLVAYYPFEGDANDESGYENHGISNGGVEYVSGINGSALKLNGVNSEGGTRNSDFIRVPNSSSLQFGNQLSISYWVKIDGDKRQTSANCSGDAVEGISGTVIAKSGDRNGFYISESGVATGMGINRYNGGKGNSTGDLLSVLGEFRFVTYTINDNLINIYVDGELKSSEIGVVDFSRANSEDLYIGVSNNAQGSCLTYWYPLDGVVDELRIYNHTLSDSEVLGLYNEGSAPSEEKPIATPLVATVEENSGVLSLRIPLIKLHGSESVSFFAANLESIPGNETLYELKEAVLVSKKEKDIYADIYDLRGQEKYIMNIYSVMYNGKNYWAQLKYKKDLVWELVAAGENNSDLNERTWDLLIDKTKIGDIVFFNQSASCEDSNCLANNSIFGILDYGYFSHAALISDIDKVNKKIEIFHAPGSIFSKPEQVRKDWFDMNKLRYKYAEGVIEVKRVKNINPSKAKKIVEDAYIKYNSYTYNDSSLGGDQTYCSKLVGDAYEDGGILINDQDKYFNDSNNFQSLIFVPDELYESKNLESIMQWRP